MIVLSMIMLDMVILYCLFFCAQDNLEDTGYASVYVLSAGAGFAVFRFDERKVLRLG